MENLCKSYKYKDIKLSILDNIKFNIKENEIVSIIGPSGVGKSTFLNLDSELGLEISILKFFIPSLSNLFIFKNEPFTVYLFFKDNVKLEEI